MPIRILLVDDHALVRQGLRSLLVQEGFSVVGEAADGLRAVVGRAETLDRCDGSPAYVGMLGQAEVVCRAQHRDFVRLDASPATARESSSTLCA